jgi:hypothetical protein
VVFFLNDRSLSQYADLAGAFRLCIKARDELSRAPVGLPVLHRDKSFFDTTDFKQRFNNTRMPSDLKAIARTIAFSDRIYGCWRPARISNETDTHECIAPQMTCRDETLAEAAARRGAAVPQAVLLLSAEGPPFEGLDSVELTKGGAAVQLILAKTEEEVRAFLGAQSGQFEPSENRVPQDSETILVKDPKRFRLKVGKRERRRGQRVYEEIATGRLFHVDKDHRGHSAHLEVFTSSLAHVGTGNIHTGAVDETKREATYWLRW